jgi:hypothetical protein
MRVAPPCQLSLGLDELSTSAGHWRGLPTDTRGEVQVLLARLIARSALADDHDGSTSAGADNER